MKKNLIFLTGIVFVLTILLAGGCKNGKKNTATEPAENATEPVEKATVPVRDPKTATIYLKDTIIEGEMHLIMCNEKHPEWRVIDDLVTIVYPRDIVKWKKADDSDIKKVKYIEFKEDYGTGIIDGNGVIRALFEFEIPHDANPGMIIYNIGFTLKKDSSVIDTTYVIDPYLRLPKETLTTE